MPRNPGTGIYTLPAGTKGTPNLPIESAKYNAFVEDIAQDLNGARPISAGGTGATSAATARTNLGVGGLATANTYTLLQTFSAGIRVDGAVGVRLGADDGLTFDDTTNLFSFTADGTVVASYVEMGRLRALATSTATPTSTTHGFQVGLNDGLNLRLDPTRIRTVNNGAEGGKLTINNGVTFASGVFLDIADGGTGAATAPGARTALGLAAIAASGSASDLSSGTLPNGRVSGAYDGITNLGMTGTLTIQSSAPTQQFLDTTSGHLNARIRVDGSNFDIAGSPDGTNWTTVLRLELDNNRGLINGSQITTAAAGTAYDSARLGGTTAAAVQSDIDSKAPLASPALTGNPTATTQSAGNNSTRLATTAFVSTAIGNINFGTENAALSAGGIGTDAFAYTSSSVSFGSTVAGSTLSPSAAGDSGSGSLSGTWRCMGRTTGSNGSTLWKRIS